VFDLLDVGENLVDREFFRGLADELVLLGEILRGKDLGGLALFEQEAAAGNLVLGNCSCRHSKTFLNHIRGPEDHRGNVSSLRFIIPRFDHSLGT